MNELPKYVDILIPSKDRALQLHHLLESMGKHLAGIGRITITWQGSSEEFVAGYELLKRRVLKDESFEPLRLKSKEIVFKQRQSLREVYDAAMDSGDSNYIMPLLDDDIFFQDYDLVNDDAARAFFENPSILACVPRLGNNLSEQVSTTKDDGIMPNGRPNGHSTALLSTGKPRYVHPHYGHLLEQSGPVNGPGRRYVMWSWADSQNIPHWGLTCSTTGQLYRKTSYLELFMKFGKENFLFIEKRGHFDLLKKFLGLPIGFFKILQMLDFMQAKLLKIFGVYEQPNLQILLAKLICRKRTSWRLESKVPIYMTAPIKSVVINLDSGGSHQAGSPLVGPSLNKKYLAGKIISHADISFRGVKFPVQLFKDFQFIDYKEQPVCA